MQVPRGSHHGRNVMLPPKFGHHSRPRPRPVVLEDGVDQQAGTEHERHDEEERRPRRHDRGAFRPEQLHEEHGDRRRDREHRHHRFQRAEDPDGAKEARHGLVHGDTVKEPRDGEVDPRRHGKDEPGQHRKADQDEDRRCGPRCSARVSFQWHVQSLGGCCLPSQLLSLPGATGQSSNPLSYQRGSGRAPNAVWWLPDRPVKAGR